MDVHPTKNGINRYWSIPIYGHLVCLSGNELQHCTSTATALTALHLFLCRTQSRRVQHTAAFESPGNLGGPEMEDFIQIYSQENDK